MASEERVHLQLELVRGIDPINGRITAPDGASVEFAGWLGLAGALQRFASQADQPGVPRPAPVSPGLSQS